MAFDFRLVEARLALNFVLANQSDADIRGLAGGKARKTGGCENRRGLKTKRRAEKPDRLLGSLGCQDGAQLAAPRLAIGVV
jgi:hypothetical protein